MLGFVRFCSGRVIVLTISTKVWSVSPILISGAIHWGSPSTESGGCQTPWSLCQPVSEHILVGGLEHFFIFPYIYYIYIGNNHPNWLIFFRGVETSNQYIHTLENTHLTSEQSLFRKANRQEYIPIHEQTLTRIVKYIYMLIIQAWYIITFIYYISVMSFNSWTSAVVLGVFYNCSDPPRMPFAICSQPALLACGSGIHVIY